MNNVMQEKGTRLPSWVKLTVQPLTTGDSITEEELFNYPSLPAEDQTKVDKGFGSLSDAFLHLDYAVWWGWPTLDVPKTTPEEAIARGWVTSYQSARTLLAALRKEGYRHTTLAVGTCLRLETVKEERKRQGACRRQQRRRERLSQAARAQIRKKDRHYRQQQRQKDRSQFCVTDTGSL